MATNTARVREVRYKKAPLEGANFAPKRERKQIRKSLIRAYVSNKVGEARVGAQERAEFYRNLRQIKLRRRKIAQEMAVLADMVGGLGREVHRVADRHREVDSSYLEEANSLVKVAMGSIAAASDEFWSFSRARVWFTEAGS